MKKANKQDDDVAVVQLVEMPNGGSDIALKKNVIEITGSLDRVAKLRPVTWNWKDEDDEDKLRYGFIAQEVEKLFPDLVEVKPWKDGTQRKFLSTNDIVPYLIAAMKEQQRQITELKKKLEK